MKEFKGIGLFFAICTLLLSFLLVGFLIGIRTTLRGSEERAREIIMDHAEQAAPEKPEKTAEFSSFLDVSSNSGLLRKNTEFVIRESDERAGTVTERTEELPDKYVGLDLDGFMECMKQYNLAPPLNEREKGFQSIAVLRFSRERVVVQKNYYYVSPEEGFYLAIQDGRVVVLLSDKRTVYMTTDVLWQTLPEEVLKGLSEMIFIEDEAALFDFLEGYSS